MIRKGPLVNRICCLCMIARGQQMSGDKDKANIRAGVARKAAINDYTPLAFPTRDRKWRAGCPGWWRQIGSLVPAVQKTMEQRSEQCVCSHQKHNQQSPL